ncbi:MAG: hypothetical protein PGN25_18395 [Methylorubrum populi]
MKNRTKITAALALALGLAATPSLAQSPASDSASYNRDGTLNVWGAHIDPAQGRGGLIGGVTGAAGNIVGGTVDAADDIVTGSVRRPAGDTAYPASGSSGRPAY